MKLTITRLRSGTNYKTPLHDIMDSFYELYKEYISKNSQYNYGVCNFGWNAANLRTLPLPLPNVRRLFRKDR